MKKIEHRVCNFEIIGIGDELIYEFDASAVCFQKQEGGWRQAGGVNVIRRSIGTGFQGLKSKGAYRIVSERNIRGVSTYSTVSGVVSQVGIATTLYNNLDEFLNYI